MDNEQNRVGSVLVNGYRGFNLVFNVTPGADGEYDFFMGEDGELHSASVEAIFDTADVAANELRRRLPESGHLVAAAVANGAVPVMGQQQPQQNYQQPQQQQQQPQDVCDRCGGEASWTPYRVIKSGRDQGKSKRSLECANGCRKDGQPQYPHTVRWQEGR